MNHHLQQTIICIRLGVIKKNLAKQTHPTNMVRPYRFDRVGSLVRGSGFEGEGSKSRLFC